jgi:TrmH family RNA methyltransferase
MELITSLSNPRVSFARKLNRRRVRDAERAFVVEGPIAVAAAQEAGLELLDVFATDPILIPSGVKGLVVTSAVMEAISDAQNPQGVAAVFRTPSGDLDRPLGDLVLVLDQMRDPGNMGTLIRAAHAAGATAVVLTPGCVDPYGPKVVRASAGALFAIDIRRDVTVDTISDATRSAGGRLVGATASSPTVMYEADLVSPVALVIGNEAWGFAPGTDELLDMTVAIPMPGPMESLNAAIAASLLLFEAVRQRRKSPS